MRFTAEEDTYIIDNRTKMSMKQIAEHLGKTHRQVIDRVKYLSRIGYQIEFIKYHVYTQADDKYIIEHWSSMKVAEIAKVIGVNPDTLRSHVKKIRDKGVQFKHRNNRTDGYTYQENREIIRDGYPDIPWWCRQSTRCQYFAPNMYHGIENYERRRRAQIGARKDD